MPELPEVETITRRLRQGTPECPPVPGHTIQSATVTWPRIIASPDPETFTQALVGKTILDVRRRAKFLHFPLSQGHLVGHLRMTGDMRMEPRFDLHHNPIPTQDYDRVIIDFTSKWRMVFVNIRKFGRMWFTEDLDTVFGELGPEPLAETFSAQILYEMAHCHSRQIKPLLMDQRFLAGLGNIYTDESLFKAGIHPRRISDSLSNIEVSKLYQAIRQSLSEGIKKFGASLDWVYRGGEFQNYFQVYQREGEPCPVCGAEIVKTIVGQRGTHFCPNCQKPPD